jgi:hypothetical protein
MALIPRTAAILSVCLALSFAACRKAEEAPPPAAPKPAGQAAAPAPPAAFRVARIDLGNAIGSDKKVASPASKFKPGDTIYASVVSEGVSPNVVLVARWTYEDGQLVSESTQTIAPTGPAATEFHISKPDGWPAGKYKVEVAANGAPTGAAEFVVAD